MQVCAPAPGPHSPRGPWLHQDRDPKCPEQQAHIFVVSAPSVEFALLLGGRNTCTMVGSHRLYLALEPVPPAQRDPGEGGVGFLPQLTWAMVGTEARRLPSGSRPPVRG